MAINNSKEFCLSLPPSLFLFQFCSCTRRRVEVDGVLIALDAASALLEPKLSATTNVPHWRFEKHTVTSPCPR